MNVWNKVLMILTGIMCLVFTVLASNRYTVIKEQETKIAKLQKDIADAQDAVKKLKLEIYDGPSASNEKGGLDYQLAHIRNLQNGETFIGCKPIEVVANDEDASSQVSFGLTNEEYTTASFRQDAMVYVFDSGEALADATENTDDVAAPADSADASVAASYQFLGIFKVAGAANNQVSLESVGHSTLEELQALKDSAAGARSWVVAVDRLPIDNIDEVESTALVDYQEKLERALLTRESENVMIDRQTVALADLTNVVADQIVAIGEIRANVADKLTAIENWDDAYKAAQGRKKVDSYLVAIEKEKAALAQMEGYRDLVKSILDEAAENVAACQREIDSKIAANADLAAKIARCQFIAAEKFKEANSRTASVDPGVAYSGI